MTGLPLLPVRRVAVLTALAAITLLPAVAGAQEPYNFTASILGGLGGSTDVDPGNGVDNFALQLGASFVTEPRTHVGLRLGRFELASGSRFGSLLDAELTYANISGEYRFSESFYESGVFLGLGAYQLEGVGAGGREDETAFGVTLGTTGEFKVNSRFSVQLELAGHYADFEDAQIFITALTGLAFHFR